MIDNQAKPDRSADLQAAIDAVEQYLSQGEPLLAYNAVQDGLEAWPDNLRLRQLKGLAIARSGDIERANRLLLELAAEGSADAETLGMLARTHKDLALGAGGVSRASHLQSAFRIYHQAYQAAAKDGVAADAWYTGINAAAIAVLQGRGATARRIAADIKRLCLRAQDDPAAANDYWLAATLGEASLILGEGGESALHFTRAAELARGRFGHLAITRRQAELLAQHLPGDNAWIAEVLKVPPVVMYAARVTHQGSAMPGFPAALEGVMAAAVRERLQLLRPVAAYGSAASGADILCLEAMQSLGLETHIVLPFPTAESPRDRESRTPGWSERLARALAAADSVTVASEHRARGSRAPFDYAHFMLTGMARLRAQVLHTELCGLAIGDGRTSAEAVSPGSLVGLWQSQHIALEDVRVPDLRSDPSDDAMREIMFPDEPLPPGFAHEIRALLFADAVGYSKLSEDQTPHFITQFLGAVADLNAASAQRPEHVETTGDGLYMVFNCARDAGHYALELKKLVTGTDWAARGLPGGLNIRIALHCGPVYCGRNPVTGAPLYTGPHTSRTARIEPITPPGQVYASSAFAAVAAASGVEGLEMHYVGRMPLAKGYGLLGLYHVGTAAEAANRAAGDGPAGDVAAIGPAAATGDSGAASAPRSVA